jgi:hypothetical protein
MTQHHIRKSVIVLLAMAAIVAIREVYIHFI